MIPGEIFPPEVRATCHGISAASGKLGAATGAYFFPLILGQDQFGHPTQDGIRRCMLICSIVAFIGAIVTVFFIPSYDAFLLSSEGSYIPLDYACLHPKGFKPLPRSDSIGELFSAAMKNRNQMKQNRESFESGGDDDYDGDEGDETDSMKGDRALSNSNGRLKSNHSNNGQMRWGNRNNHNNNNNKDRMHQIVYSSHEYSMDELESNKNTIFMERNRHSSNDDLPESIKKTPSKSILKKY